MQSINSWVICLKPNELGRELDLKSGTPRPGLEPGSKAPQASRMSTTPPGRVYCLPYLSHCYRLNNPLFGAALTTLIKTNPRYRERSPAK
jgi:hypothetical protein